MTETETKTETAAERIGTETRMDIGETETARDQGKKGWSLMPVIGSWNYPVMSITFIKYSSLSLFFCAF